jgi:asparagine synthase (glutamine-hydrolysing)
VCGIGGIVSWSGPVARDRLDAIGRVLAHRGPDGSGSLDWGWLGFAHRRLAVIDVQGSTQPMCDPSGRFALTYNGEIFNFRELRSWLEGRGHVFRTAGDVEVLLRLLMDSGEAALPRLDGQFAFAFADAEKGTVLLARDRVGIKPLHVARRAGEIVFASEIKGVLAALPAPPLRPESVDLFLTLRYVPSPWTIYDGIEKLAPGAAMTVCRDGAIDGPRPWFRVDEPVEIRDPGQDEIEAVLQQSVASQLVSDVPLACLLSGGIDSSTVAVLAARALGGSGRLRTVTVGFEDERLDERPHAHAVARAIGSSHEDVLAAPDGGADRSAEAFLRFDEPFADSSVRPTDRLFAAARSMATVALGGDGGDELFFGYRVYHRAMTAELGRRALREGPVLDRLLVGARRMVSGRYRGLLVKPALQMLLETRTIVGADGRRRLYRGTRLETLPDPLPGTSYLEGIARRAEAGSGGDPFRALMLADLLSFLPECCLVKVDRLSMRHGLEVRVPLLGNGPLALGLALPTASKALVEGPVCRGGKRPLREILARAVPDLDTRRRKRGFGEPVSEGTRAEFSRLLSGSGGSRLREWCDPAALGRLDGGAARSDARGGEAMLAVLALSAFLDRQEVPRP